MKKISDTDYARLREYASNIDDARNELDSFISDMQEKVGEYMSKLNDWIDEANGFVSDLSSEADTFYEERSEAWRDGEKGQSYYDWKLELEEAASRLSSLNWSIDASEVTDEADNMLEAINNIRQSYEE